MSDFKEFQRDTARREADAQRREDEERNADLERDDAYERKHRRRGRKVSGAFGMKRKRLRGTTPIWRLTAGTWAQVLLSVLWIAALGFGSGAFSGPSSDGKGWLSVLIFIAGAILGAITWRLIGPRARELMRSGLRFGAVAGVVVIVGMAVWRNATNKERSAARAPVAATTPQPAASPQPASTASTASTSPSSAVSAPSALEPVGFASSVDALVAALRGEDQALAWRALDAIAESHDRSRTAYERARRVPAAGRVLADAIARLDELATLEEALKQFASTHIEQIEARAPSERGAQIALRFAAPTRAHTEALVGAALATRDGEDTTALDSLTILLARGAPMPRAEAITPIHVAWWKARASTRPKDRDAACRALGAYMVSGSARERSLTEGALRDVAPRCTAAGPVILKRLLAQAAASKKTPMTPADEAHWSWAFHALGHTGIENAGAVQRFLGDVEKLGGLRGASDAGAVLDTMFEAHLMHASGVSRMVWNNPAGTAGLTRPALTLGACSPAQVGMKREDEVARLGERPCVTQFQGDSLARAPLGNPSAPRAASKSGSRL